MPRTLPPSVRRATPNPPAARRRKKLVKHSRLATSPSAGKPPPSFSLSPPPTAMRAPVPPFSRQAAAGR
ncbi:MAG: hypothetical protein LBR12_01775 [Opitutaceae bacterium]|nr:hypothetical protein [Opitutaceae bacterium]